MRRILSVILMVTMLSTLTGCFNQPSIDYGNAIFNGMYGQCSELLSDGVDVNKIENSFMGGYSGDESTNSLIRSIQYGYTDILELMLKYEATPDASDNNGYSVIGYAVMSDNIEACELLLNYGADINYTGDSEKGVVGYITSIEGIAELKKENEMFDYLMGKGATLTYDELLTVEAEAQSGSNINYVLLGKMAKEFLSKNNISDYKDNELLAIVNGDYEGFLALARENKYQPNSLIYATAYGNSECMDVLVSAGMKLELSDKANISLLAVAAQTGNIDTMKYIIDNSELIEECGSEALCTATTANQTNAYKMLIENGADITDNDYTIEYLDFFAYAAIYDNMELLKLIGDNGYSNDDAEGAMYCACMFGNEEALKYILEKGVNPDTKYSIESPLYVAARYGNPQCIELLLEYGATIDLLVDNSIDDRTALVAACEAPDLECVKCLVEAGADVNYQYRWYSGEVSYPLIAAVERGYLDVVKYLVENGAKISEYILKTADYDSSEEIFNYLSEQ